MATTLEAVPTSDRFTGEQRSPRQVPALVIAAVALLAGIALRAWLLSTPLGRADSDESVGGLAARHIIRGDFFTFLPGSHYGGTLLGILVSPATWLWDAAVVLKVAEIAAFASASLLIWRVGRRTVGAQAAVLGAAIFWVFPGASVLASTKGRLYYGLSLVLGLLLVLLVLRIIEQPTRRDVLALGLVAGLGLWSGPFILYFALPAGLWLLFTRRSVIRELVAAIPTALMGAAPWLVYNLRNDFAGLMQRDGPVPNSLEIRWEGFWKQVLPKSLGLKQSYNGDWLLGDSLSRALFLALMAGFVAAAVFALRRRSPSRLLLLIGVVYPLLYVVPEAHSYVNEPRYGLFLMPVVVLLAGQALTRLLRPVSLQVVAVGGLAGLSALSLVNLKHWSEQYPANFDLTAPKIANLADHLEEEGVDALFADYWIAYRLSAATNEDIVATSFIRKDARIPEYERRAEAIERPTYAFFTVSPLRDEFFYNLVQSKIPYSEQKVDVFSVYTLDRPLRR